MNRMILFFASFCVWIAGFLVLIDHQPVPTIPPIEIQPPILPIQPPLEPDLVGVQVAIPKDCRVYNKSGSQCVWCSIESLCRFHEIKEGYEGNTRLTKNYTWGTGPGEVQRVLNTKYPNIKWKQIQNRSQLKDFIKRYVVEKKFGIGLGIPGHMLNLVHYDEEKKIVKVIDNGGPKALQVQDWTMDRFERLADGWALTIFPPGYQESAGDDVFDRIIPEPNKVYFNHIKQTNQNLLQYLYPINTIQYHYYNYFE